MKDGVKEPLVGMRRAFHFYGNRGGKLKAYIFALQDDLLWLADEADERATVLSIAIMTLSSDLTLNGSQSGN